MDYSFEEMSDSHRQAVIDILNYFIRQSYAAYPEESVDYHFFDRFLEMSRGYPALVIKAGDHQVVGFGFMRPHHFADSFKRTAEVSYFITPGKYQEGAGHHHAGFIRAGGRAKGNRFSDS
ncbi:MAG: hypothetical protein HY743_02800 [Deltaproteobacteria bacterium]|nr:hypothetical protein [Deltaproteobacteria bacterium]